MSGSSTWTDIPNGDIDQDSPATETLFTAIRDNIIAQSWSYYDDGDGVIYNHAVDGNVTTIVSPDFDDGYEYLFVADELDGTSDTVFPNLNIEAYYDQDAAYGGVVGTPINIAGGRTGIFAIRLPRIGVGALFFNADDDLTSDGRVATDRTSKIDRVRFSVQGGADPVPTFVGGKLIMLRRHVSV